MNFKALVKQVAAEDNTTPEHVYREMQRAIEDAFHHRFDTAESLTLWRELGFSQKCPTPEQFIGKLAMELRGEIGIFH